MNPRQLSYLFLIAVALVASDHAHARVPTLEETIGRKYVETMFSDPIQPEQIRDYTVDTKESPALPGVAQYRIVQELKKDHPEAFALRPHKTNIPVHAEWSPDGKLLTATSRSGPEVWIIERETGKKVHKILLESEGYPLAWSPAGKLLAISIDGVGLQIIDSKTGTIIVGDIPLIPHLNLFDWSPNGKFLAGVSYDDKIEIINSETGTSVHSIPKESPDPVIAWNPDSKFLAVCYRNNKIQIINCETGAIEHTLEIKASSISWSPDGEHLAATEANRIQILDKKTGIIVCTIPFKTSRVVWSPNSKFITFNNDRKLWIAYGATGAIVNTISLEGQVQSSVAWSPDSKLLATCAYMSNDAHIIRGKTGIIEHTIPHGRENVRQIAWSPDGKFLTTSTNFGNVRFIDGRTGAIAYTLSRHGQINWSPDNKFILIGGTLFNVQLLRANLSLEQALFLIYLHQHKTPFREIKKAISTLKSNKVDVEKILESFKSFRGLIEKNYELKKPA